MPICLVIPQGINSQFFHLNNISKKYRLLAVGSINKRKGHLILIESMLKIKRLYPDFSLSIVGTLSDQKYYELLLNSINEKELESQVKIYPNATFDEILNFYKNAEIFVLSTEEESQGIVFCEAMAAGLPIVATKVGGVPWVVKDNINGILCDFGDSEALADNVIKLFENESFRNNMREMNKIESHKYDWGNIAIEIMNVYQSII